MTPKQKRLMEEDRYVRQAKKMLQKYGDYAYARVLEHLFEAEAADHIISVPYWRRVLDELNKLPPSGGEQTKE